MRIWFGLASVLVLTLLVGLLWHGLVFKIALSTGILALVRLVLMVAAVGWAALFVDAWRLGHPLSLHLGHRRAVVGVNGVLCLSVAGTLLFGAHVVGRAARLRARHVRRRHGQRRPRRPLQRAARGRRLRRRPLGPAPRLDDGRQHRRRDRQDRADRAAAQHDRTSRSAKGSVMDEQFPDGFDADYLNGVSTWAQDNTELFPAQQDARHGRHDHGDRGHHRPARSTTGRW